MPNEPITDLVFIQHDSTAKEEENLAFRTFVKTGLELSDRRLNAVVQEITEQVWSDIDCRTCANCCKIRQPALSRHEAQRIATHLGMTLQDLVAQYLTSDADVGKYTTQQCPCPFLEDNLCTIYTVRPAVCKNYPHLHRNLRSRLWQLLDNASVCPIVYNVLESLKARFGFRHMKPE
jgi:Fe-S-cluster containining protein